MEIIVMLFVLMAIAPFVLICWLVREGFVKPYRCHKWYKKHGNKIGSDEFFDWCRVNGVDPGYYL